MKLKIGSLVMIIFLMATSTAVYAQGVGGFVESYNTADKLGITPQLNVYAHGPLKGKLGWSLWTLTSKTYSEAYAGLTFAPAKWVEISGSLGLETDNYPLRVGTCVWLGKGRWSLLSIHEQGGSGYWYRYLGKFQATKTVAVGVNSTRFLGTGPYAEKQFGKITVWGTYAIDNNKGVAGIKFSF